LSLLSIDGANMSMPGSKKKDTGGGDGRFFTTTKKGEVRQALSPTPSEGSCMRQRRLL
jgi:hypothetical protein